MHLTPEGEGLIDQLFASTAPPRFSPWLARPGWVAARLSLNLPTAPEALATALPPSTPATQRQAVNLGRMALPMTAGINWTQLVGGLSGHVALGYDLRVPGDNPPSILLLGVKDKAIAAAGLKAVAKKFSSGGGLFGMGDAKPETINGLSVWKLTFKSGPAWACLADDMIADGVIADGVSADSVIVVASDPALLTRPTANSDAAWALLDAPQTVLAIAGDLKAVGSRLPAGAPVDGWPAHGGLALKRGAPGLTLSTANAPGVSVDALVQLGLWLRGQRPIPATQANKKKAQ